MRNTYLGIPYDVFMEHLAIPPIPPYEGLHPIVVHFPVALLTIIPLFIVLAAVWKSQTRGLMLATLVLCALGTGAAFLAVSTGEASEKFAKGVPGAESLVHDHEEAAELARNLSIGLTVMLAISTVAAYRLGDKLTAKQRLVGGLVLLALSVPQMLVLANASHLGGRIVHEFGVRAPLGATPGLSEGGTPSMGDDDDD